MREAVAAFQAGSDLPEYDDGIIAQRRTQAGDSGQGLLNHGVVPLASEGLHWRCNGAIRFFRPARSQEDAPTRFRFVLPWSLCTFSCNTRSGPVDDPRGRFRDECVAGDGDGAASCPSGANGPVDVVIPAHSKDAEALQNTVAGAWKHVAGVRRVIVVSAVPLCNASEFFDETRFPFTMADVKESLAARGIFANNTKRWLLPPPLPRLPPLPPPLPRPLSRPLPPSPSSPSSALLPRLCSPFGWYLQQLLKLYAPITVPGIAERVLVLDADTVFLAPVRFYEAAASTGMETATTVFTVTGDQSTHQVAHMSRVVPGLERQHPWMSAIAHHMLLEGRVVRQLFDTVEGHHGKSFYRAFLDEIDESVEHKVGVFYVVICEDGSRH